MQTQSFFSNSLGINDRQVATMIWAEVVHRLVLVQKSKRLCVARCGTGAEGGEGDGSSCALQGVGPGPRPRGEAGLGET